MLKGKKSTETLVDSCNQFEKSEKTKKSKTVICERIVIELILIFTRVNLRYKLYEEFDPGSGRTLAARLTHASRAEKIGFIRDS